MEDQMRERSLLALVAALLLISAKAYADPVPERVATIIRN